MFPEFPILYGRLFSLLLKNRETPEDALQMANKALMKSSDAPDLYAYFAWGIYENDAHELLPLAEKWMTNALDALPGNETLL